MSKLNKEWFEAAFYRAVRTMAQVALSMFTVGQTFAEVDWKMVVSCAVTAGIYSLLMSVVLGTPESDTNGTVNLDNYQGDDIMYVSDLKIDPEKLKNMKTVRFKVQNKQ